MPGAEHRVIADRYELSLPIGRGGMGEVWAGYDQRLDRPIAVKLLRRDLFPIGDPAASRAEVIRRRFVREARSTARIEHPGVPAVYDAGLDGDELYLVMQLMGGVPLSDFLAEGESPMPIPAAAAVAAQLASVLATAHSVALVHRDLKPSNILIEETGQVAVLDFGIAALLDPELTQLTRGDETLGSPAYMAPEQVLHAQVSPRADLYALGCVFYELLTGGPMFEAETSYALMQAHVDHAPRSPQDARPEVPDDIAALVVQLLAKDPADRPSSASDVYERLLGHVQADDGTSAHPHDPTRPFRKPFAPLPGGARAEQPRRPTVGSPEPSPSEQVDVDAIQDEAADLLEAGRHTQAAGLLRRALDAAMRTQQNSAERDLRLALANAYLIGEDFASALPEYEAVRAHDAVDPELDLFCRHQIAVCRAATGDTSGALHDFRELFDLRVARLGREDPDTIEVGRQIVLLMASTGDVSGAIDFLTDIITHAPSSSAELSDLLSHLHRLERR